jgi:hypothetical protein
MKRGHVSCPYAYLLALLMDLVRAYGLRAILVTATQRFVTDPARVETAIGAGKARRRQ